MISVQRIRRTSAALAAVAFVAFASHAFAQEIPESHVKAARAAIAAIHATDAYDNILPQASVALKSSLIQQNPDLQELIIATVDEKTLAMAARRSDLEREAALAYARTFSEEQLNAITAFYTSDTGKKLLTDGPIVAREVLKAVDIWQNGIARDLADQVGTQLEAVVNKGRPAPPEPGAPAPDAPAPAPAP